MDPQLVNHTFGPLFVGTWIQCLLLGVIILLATRFYTLDDSHTKRSSYMVGALILLTGLEVTMSLHVGYSTAVVHFGQYVNFEAGVWVMWIEPVITAIIGGIAHMFFIERCWYATNKSRAICVMLFLGLLLSLGSGVVVSIFFWKVKLVSKLSTIPVPMGLWLGASAFTDIGISIIMSLALSEDSNQGRSHLADRVLQLVTETGFLSAVVSILNLVLYFAMRKTTVYFIAQLALPGVYTLTVLANLRAHKNSTARLSSFGTYNNTVKDSRISRVEVQVSRVVEHDGLPEKSMSETETENKMAWNAV